MDFVSHTTICRVTRGGGVELFSGLWFRPVSEHETGCTVCLPGSHGRTHRGVSKAPDTPYLRILSPEKETHQLFCGVKGQREIREPACLSLLLLAALRMKGAAVERPGSTLLRLRAERCGLALLTLSARLLHTDSGKRPAAPNTSNAEQHLSTFRSLTYSIRAPPTWFPRGSIVAGNKRHLVAA
ncbi:hypothetical protein MHYP_G00053220 [Metynnis hypsauchen]